MTNNKNSSREASKMKCRRFVSDAECRRAIDGEQKSRMFGGGCNCRPLGINNLQDLAPENKFQNFAFPMVILFLL